MSYETIQVTPLTSNIGAEVDGVNLGQLSDQIFSEVHAALLEHQVLFFRGQRITPEDQIALAQRFGEMEVHEVFPSLPGYPEVSVLEHDEQRPPFSDVWHSDVTYRDKPSMASILYSRTIPPVGGDTLWLSAYAAYEALSEPMKGFLSGLTAVHDFVHAYGNYFLQQENGREVYRKAQDERPPVEHPIIVTHPLTGKNLLYVNPTFTSHIVDLSPIEGKAILEMLFEHLRKPDFQVRFKWQENDLAIWDNRATQHYATGDYYPHFRQMHRITVGGTKPEYQGIVS